MVVAPNPLPAGLADHVYVYAPDPPVADDVNTKEALVQ